jgi:hypothetical protein
MAVDLVFISQGSEALIPNGTVGLLFRDFGGILGEN